MAMASLCCMQLRRGLISTAVLCNRRQPIAVGPYLRHCSTVTKTDEDGAAVHQPAVPPDPVPGEYPLPAKEGEPVNVTEKVSQIVNLVKSLTLVETVQLIDKLKADLNISDIVMSGGGGGAGAGGGEEEEEDAAPAAVEQTEFTVKVESFAAESKIKLIKEIKASIEGINLVQARKLLEELPATIQAELDKDTAEALKAKLEAAGAVVKVD